MTRTPLPGATTALAGLLLTGCAAEQARYPSLAPRATEKIGFAEPEKTPAATIPDPALDTRLAELGRRIDVIASGFASDSARAGKAVAEASGQRAGSERWITAQTTLATLDDWRAQASAIVTDIEQLAIDRAATLAPDYPSVNALRDRAQGEAVHETTVIARLSQSLPQR